MEQPPGFVTRGVWIGMQATPLIIWPKAIPSSLVWPIYFHSSGVWYDSEYNKSLGFLSSYEFKVVHLFDCLCG